MEYLSDSFLSFVQTESSARQVLHNLDTIYERKSIATQLAIRKKLLGLKLQCDTPLISHFTIFDDLISELLTAGAELEETDKVSHLLLTLPTSYEGVITAIETLSEDNLTLGFIKTRLLDHEVKVRNESSDTSVKVLQANKGNIAKRQNFEFPRLPKKFYRGQHKTWSFKPNRSLSIVKCHHCGRMGHVKKDCFYYKRGLQHQNAEKTRTVQTVQVPQPSTVGNISSFAFVVGGFQSEVDVKNKITFLLDSGASDHLINREDLAVNFNELEEPIKISVAKNETFITATKKGTMNVTTNMGIQGTCVYYCPDVSYNLLSVRRIQQAGLTTTFDDKGVKISKNANIIMTGKQLNNLTGIEFIVHSNEVNSIVQVNSTEKDSYELWHQRLGHIGKTKFLELKAKQMFEDIGQIEKSNS